MNHYKIRSLVLTFGFSILLASLAMDLYVSFLPTMPLIFFTTPVQVQKTVTVFLLVMGLSKLFIGIFAPYVKLSRMLIACILLYAAASFSIAIVPSIEAMTIARAVQAFGACGGVVLAYALVRERTHGVEAQRVFSYMTGLNAFSPMFGAIIGLGIAHLAGSWRAVFVAMGLYACAVALKMVLFFAEEEPLPVTEHAASLKQSWQDTLVILSEKEFWRWIWVPTTVLMGFFLFFGTSPHYFQTTLGFSPWVYSVLFGGHAFAYFVGAVSTGWWLQDKNAVSLIRCGMWMVTLLMVCVLGISLHPIAQTQTGGLMVAFLLYGAAIFYGCIHGASLGLLLEPFQTCAAMASAWSGTIQYLIPSLIANAVIHPPILSMRPLAVAMILMSVWAQLAMRFFRAAER